MSVMGALRLWGPLGAAWIICAGCVDQQAPVEDAFDGGPPSGADMAPTGPDLAVDGDPNDGRVPADRGPTDGGMLADRGPPDAGALADGGAPDLVATPPAEHTHFIERGRCFEQTPRCADDADCDRAVFRACVDGRCHVDMPCGCVDDADCVGGDLCARNQRVCGVCLPAPDRCPEGACGAGEICVDGWCRDDCPGHGAGPPLACRGEPPAGPCDGRWAYLREAGTCVPVDGVACGPGHNSFARRADCVAHCRGPVACTATYQHTGEGAGRSVACAISHGPGACVALALCLCEMLDGFDAAGDGREDLRVCAAVYTGGGGGFDGQCNGSSISEIIADMRRGGRLDALLPQGVELRLSPGCADVPADDAAAPTCDDGRRSGWETGIDCGIQGCEPCP